MVKASDSPDPSTLEAVTDSLLVASRALVGVAAKSLAAIDDDVTLPQYRALVVLASRGSLASGDLAEALGLHPSTVTRLCNRLVTKGLVRRTTPRRNRREIHITLTAQGRAIVDQVTRLRRAEIARIVGRIPSDLRPTMIAALVAFSEAAGEVPEQAWSLGWSS